MKRYSVSVLLAAGALAVPLFASAQIIITQIVYDPAGADTGREWIEFLNTGTSSIRLTDFKLRTSGVNHKITAISGGDTLSPQAHAAIMQDASLFAADNPSFIGPVFHASFSLTNKNGTVAIADKSGAIIATSSYQAPPPAPASPKSVHAAGGVAVKNSKSQTFRQKFDFSRSDGKNTDTDPTASSSAVAAASAPLSASSLWWMGLIALLGTAGIAAFASPYIAKKRNEWEITEEQNGD